MENVNNFGLENRKLLLRRIKDYYSDKQARLEPDDMNSCTTLDVVCENESVREETGYMPVFADDDITQVFYNYRTGESFLALNTETGVVALSETYSKVSTFAGNLAINLGLCYQIFIKECELIDDPELSEALFNEAEKLRNFLFGKMKLYTY